MLSYDETIEAIHHIPRKSKEHNLDRMNKFMAILGHPEIDLPMIHVTGTNGKGSICKMLEETLINCGYNVGLFTSPYIFDFRERIQLNKNPISKEELVLYYEKIVSATESLKSLGFTSPTEFEVVTAIGFMYFKDHFVDVAIIEVGIGGLYDATNVINPILSILSSISKDHTAILGNSLESIAHHKAGIIKKSPTISTSQLPEVRNVLLNKAKETGSKLTFLKSNQVRYLGLTGRKQKVRYEFHDSTFTVDLSLLGIHQMLNAGTAILALKELIELGFPNITQTKIQHSLSQVSWPGRLEMISENPLIFIDGAHNMAGAISLKESLELYYPKRSIILLMGVLKDKDPEILLKVMTQNIKKAYFITPQDPRGMLATDLQAIANQDFNTEAVSSMKEAVEKALNLYTENDLILAAGSLYTIADFKSIFTSTLDQRNSL